MNPETKEFIDVEEANKQGLNIDDWPRFKVGDQFTLNGVLFSVRKVTKKDVVLRPVHGKPHKGEAK